MDNVWDRLRGEWKAIFGIGFLVIVAFWVFAIKKSGAIDIQEATVIRFGTYADEQGEFPTVLVRMSDGRQLEVKTDRFALERCAIGSHIQLMVRHHNISVAAGGCR